MGLPIDRLVIATNSNDILARTLASGDYIVQTVHPTQSPSMDIQVSSNFERLLFEAHGRDAGALCRLMTGLRQSQAFTIESGPLHAIRAEFDAFSVPDSETTREIARSWREAGFLADPHTAVGIGAARKAKAHASESPLVVLGTAHPAKFPAAIAQATGMRPDLPGRLTGLFKRKEKFSFLPNDQSEIEHFIHSRAARASKRATL
jgi:threonine synthase